MTVLYGVLFVVSAITAIEVTLCPKKQDEWEIETLLPHKECNKFYQCTHSVPIEMSCPDGLVFSITERICDWRDRVKCGERIFIENINIEVVEVSKLADNTSLTAGSGNNNTSDINETVNPEDSVTAFLPNGCPVDPEVHWLLPHETFCNLFYNCVWGGKELSRCPFWLYFNKKLQVCDWPRNAGCTE